MEVIWRRCEVTDDNDRSWEGHGKAGEKERMGDCNRDWNLRISQLLFASAREGSRKARKAATRRTQGSLRGDAREPLKEPGKTMRRVSLDAFWGRSWRAL